MKKLLAILVSCSLALVFMGCAKEEQEYTPVGSENKPAQTDEENHTLETSSPNNEPSTSVTEEDVTLVTECRAYVNSDEIKQSTDGIFDSIELLDSAVADYDEDSAYEQATIIRNAANGVLNKQDVPESAQELHALYVDYATTLNELADYGFKAADELANYNYNQAKVYYRKMSETYSALTAKLNPISDWLNSFTAQYK